MEEERFTGYARKFQKLVYRLAYSHVGNSADAEDIMQEAFLRLYTCGNSFASDENVKAWLIRVTVNLSKTHLRSAWIHKRRELPQEDIPCADGQERELYEAIRALPANYRTAIYLHYCEGYKVEELARLLQTSGSNIKLRLKRGREKLRGMIIDE